ncbi:hypothetical protein BVX94_00685, partial [bacterium B17]
IYIASEKTSILVDAGLSCKEIERRLGEIGVEASEISAICITHEHGDHQSGVGVMFSKHGMDMYANDGAVDYVESRQGHRGIRWNVFTTGEPFEIEDIQVEPFSIPHDSYDPVGFALTVNGVRVVIATDMGMVTTLIREKMKNADILVLECNHDEILLKESDRPWSLKQRIAGRQGHLSNSQAAEALIETAGPNLSVVFVAHMSSECNEPDLALSTIRKALDNHGRSDVDVKLTRQSYVSDLIEIPARG